MSTPNWYSLLSPYISKRIFNSECCHEVTSKSVADTLLRRIFLRQEMRPFAAPTKWICNVRFGHKLLGLFNLCPGHEKKEQNGKIGEPGRTRTSNPLKGGRTSG